jgi:hypothetical protein
MNEVAIIYPEKPSATIRRAIDFLSSYIAEFTIDFPLCVSEAEVIPEGVRVPIYIGTKENSKNVFELSDVSLDIAEQYYISVKNRRILIEGYDNKGVLNGVMDFYNKYLLGRKYRNFKFSVCDLFESDTSDYSLISAPSVSERGIWTWGHVIYDYKRFLDNMAKLKLNSLIIWNDFVPFNIGDIINHAHELGIKIILGYTWGWDQRCREMSLSALSQLEGQIFEKYKKEYAHLDIDGIYFQTITELDDEYIDGVLVADAVTKFVNKTAAVFYQEYPNLLIEFGLHATSVKNKLEYIQKVDPRVRIVWEDLGAMPFSYSSSLTEGYDDTEALVKNISVLRGKNDNFGIVPKSLTCLDWSTFRHPEASQNIGVSTDALKENRIIRKRKSWRVAVAGWLANGELAQRMIKELCSLKGTSFSVNSLLEDGMFEEQIMYPIALFSEMLWNPEEDYRELVRSVSLRDYVRFS